MATDSCFRVHRDYAWDGAEHWASFQENFEREKQDEAGMAASILGVNIETQISVGIYSHPMLLATLAPATGRVVTTYRPSDRPAMFLEVANIRPTPDSVLQFVRRNGLLCSLSDASIPRKTADTFGDWLLAITILRRSLVLYGAISRDDRQLLDSAFEWEKRQLGELEEWAIWFDEPNDWGPLRKTFMRSPSGLEKSLIGDNAWAARMMLREYVNENVGDVGRPSLDDQLRFSADPGRLAEWIWLQLAEAIDVRRTFNQCTQCDKFFEVSGGASRSDREYCSTACRLKAYRERMKVAKSLADEGLGVREIAKRLQSEPDTISGWLALPQGRPLKRGRGKRKKRK